MIAFTLSSSCWYNLSFSNSHRRLSSSLTALPLPAGGASIAVRFCVDAEEDRASAACFRSACSSTDTESPEIATWQLDLHLTSLPHGLEHNCFQLLLGIHMAQIMHIVIVTHVILVYSLPWSQLVACD